MLNPVKIYQGANQFGHQLADVLVADPDGHKASGSALARNMGHGFVESINPFDKKNAYDIGYSTANALAVVVPVAGEASALNDLRLGVKAATAEEGMARLASAAAQGTPEEAAAAARLARAQAGVLKAQAALKARLPGAGVVRKVKEGGAKAGEVGAKVREVGAKVKERAAGARAAAKTAQERRGAGRKPGEPHTPESLAAGNKAVQRLAARRRGQSGGAGPRQPALAHAGSSVERPTSRPIARQPENSNVSKMAAQGSGHAPVPAGRVAAPGGRVVDYLIYDDDAKVPAHYRNDPRFRSLATDPAHVGITDAKMRQEAMAGLEAEHQGLVPGPITRGPKEIEFYDGNGSPWDVKTPPSPKPGETWPFKPKKIVEGIQKELVGKGTPPGTYPNANTGIPEPRQIILDSSYMNPVDHAALWKDLNSTLTPSELNRIVEVNTRT